MLFRRKKLLMFVFMSLFLFSFYLSFAQEYEKVEIKTEKAGEGVYVLFGAGGNIGVCIGEDGALFHL